MMDNDLWDKFFRIAGVALLLIVPLALLGLWKLYDLVCLMFMHVSF